MENPTNKKDMNYRLVRYFLNHTQLSVMLFVILVIGGIFGYSRLHIEGFPEVEIPIAIVSVVDPGAGPETVSNSVVSPLESAIGDVKGVKQVTSTSQNSIGFIVVQFDDGVTQSTVIQDIRTKISSVKLPDGVKTPDISVPNIGTAPYIVAVTGNKSLDNLIADSNPLTDKLNQLDGVQSVKLVSGVKQNIYIDLAPQYLNPVITEQISSSNIEFPLGQAIINGQLTTLTGKRQVTSSEDLKQLPIKLPTGQSVLLKDIANVYTGTNYGGQIHWVGYKDANSDNFIRQKALLYEVRLTKDADILKLDTKIQDAIKDAKSQITEADYTLVFNQAEDSRRQVKEIVEGVVGGKWDVHNPIANLGYVFGGIWLLMLAILAFLDWRSALISATAIPLSFLFTFLFLALFGIQLNTIVLFSLVLVLGLVADPAIVVLESIKRYIEIGFKGKTAVLESIDKIGRGVFIAVLTSLVVFIPFAIVSGTFGEIIKYIPLTVIPALVASYFVPMLFLTWISGKFLKPGKGHHPTDENDPQSLWPIAQWFIKANRYILKHIWLEWTVIILALVIPVLIAGWLFSSGKIRQVQFAQPKEAEFLTVQVPVSADTTETELVKKSIVLDEILKKYTDSISTYFYQYQGGSAQTAQPFSLFIHLKNPNDRIQKSSDILDGLELDLKNQFGDKSFAADLGAGPPEESYQITVKVYDTDSAKLLEAAKKIVEQLKTYSEVTVTRYDGDTQATELSMTLDPERLSNSGLTAPSVYGQVSSILGERSLFNLNEREVIVRASGASKPNSVEALGNVVVFGSRGPVALKDVANIVPTQVSDAIKSFNGDRYIDVQAKVADSRDAITIQRTIDDWVKDNTSQLGLPARAFENRAGGNEFEKSFQQLFLAIALSILATYVIFVLFFRSFLQPFIILAAIPLLFIGAFPALVWFGNGQLGFLETLGVIMVIGIVENVGIFLIDYANRKVAEGMDKRDAIALSAGIRFRPIILTKFTALAGLLPLAVFAPFWRGLAVVVIGGILSSGILSLFTTPILYSWFTRVKKAPQAEVIEAEPISTLNV